MKGVWVGVDVCVCVCMSVCRGVSVHECVCEYGLSGWV